MEYGELNLFAQLMGYGAQVDINDTKGDRFCGQVKFIDVDAGTLLIVFDWIGRKVDDKWVLVTDPAMHEYRVNLYTAGNFHLADDVTYEFNISTGSDSKVTTVRLSNIPLIQRKQLVT